MTVPGRSDGISSFLQCFDAIGWIVEKVSGLLKTVPVISRVSFLEQLEGKSQGGNRIIRIHLKMAVKTASRVYIVAK